jgi:hypothetical protein
VQWIIEASHNSKYCHDDMHRNEEIYLTNAWIQQFCELYHEEHLWNIQYHHCETTTVPTNSAIFNKDEEDIIVKFVNNHNSEQNSKNTK